MFHILLADDEKMALLSTEHSLPFSAHHMAVTVRTSDSLEALRLLETRFIDAAFLDIRMPGLSGLDIIQKCREQPFCPRFIVVSGYSDFAYMKQAIQLGAFDYCLKPIQSEEADALLRRLEEELCQSRMQNGPDMLRRLSDPGTQTEFLRYLGFAEPADSLTVIAVLAAHLSDLWKMELPEQSFLIPMDGHRAVLLTAAGPGEADALAERLLELPECRLAVGNLDPSAGQLGKLLEQLQTDLRLTNSEKPVIRSVLNASNDAFGRLLEEVRTQYRQELSLQTLAQKYNLSYSYCSELFKAATGFTFSKYINQLRLTTAAELLRNSQQSVADICYQVGYHNYHHFVGMFKSYFNLTPTEYRQQGGHADAPLH